MSTKSESTMSVVELQKMIKDAALASIIQDGIDEHLDYQTDSYKWVMPIEIEGVVHYAEFAMTAKKADYDESNLHDEVEKYAEKKAKAEEREADRATKRAEKAAAKAAKAAKAE